MDYLSESLQLAGEKAVFDTHAKRILANKQVLARILKKTVSEFTETAHGSCRLQACRGIGLFVIFV